MLSGFQASWIVVLGLLCLDFIFFKKKTKTLFYLCVGVYVRTWCSWRSKATAKEFFYPSTTWSLGSEPRSLLCLAASPSSYWATSLAIFFQKWCVFWTTFFFPQQNVTSFNWKVGIFLSFLNVESKLSRKHRSSRNEQIRRKMTSKCHWRESRDWRGSKRSQGKWDSKELESEGVGEFMLRTSRPPEIAAGIGAERKTTARG